MRNHRQKKIFRAICFDGLVESFLFSFIYFYKLRSRFFLFSYFLNDAEHSLRTAAFIKKRSSFSADPFDRMIFIYDAKFFFEFCAVLARLPQEFFNKSAIFGMHCGDQLFV